MPRSSYLRVAGIALVLYGGLGLVIALAMLVVGISTFDLLTTLQRTLEAERSSLVDSIRTVSVTLEDTSGATTSFQQSVGNARTAADQASRLANDSAGTFRELATQSDAIVIFGVRPLAGVSPQFAISADQMQQLAIQLGATREALTQNVSDIPRVGGDLGRLQVQLDAVATSLNQPGALAVGALSLLPFQVAFYGLCLLVTLQSLFSLAAGIVVYRWQPADPAFARSRVGAFARSGSDAAVEHDEDNSAGLRETRERMNPRTRER